MKRLNEESGLYNPINIAIDALTNNVAVPETYLSIRDFVIQFINLIFSWTIWFQTYVSIVTLAYKSLIITQTIR